MKKVESVASWHDIPDTTINAFVKAVYKLRDKMIPVDCDGDSAINLTIVDRRKCEYFPYEPIPYSHHHGEIPEEELEAEENWRECMILMNFKSASNTLSNWIEKNREDRERNKKTKEKQ